MVCGRVLNNQLASRTAKVHHVIRVLVNDRVDVTTHSMATLLEIPGQTTHFNMGLVKNDTQFGDDLLTQDFSRELEKYYDKADPSDQAKCLELLAALRDGKAVRRQNGLSRRPKTAMPALETYDIQHVTLPYETTYKREYIPRPNPSIKATRPATSQGFLEPDSIPDVVHKTTYDEEFHKKLQRPATPVRSGTASGQRNNKPHPTKAFMVWKFPSKTQVSQPGMPWSEELTNEKLNQVTKRLCRSTYQRDYLGIPQGFQVQNAFNLPPDWREGVPYSTSSFQRAIYKPPGLPHPDLAVGTTRYGSNKNKHLASTGVIPTANLRALGVKSRTTYDRHFNDTAPDVVLMAHDVTRRLAVLNQPPHPDRPSYEAAEAATPFQETFERELSPCPASSPSSHSRPSMPTPTRARPVVPAATHISRFCFTNQAHQPSPPSTPFSVPYSPPAFLS